MTYDNLLGTRRHETIIRACTSGALFCTSQSAWTRAVPSDRVPSYVAVCAWNVDAGAVGCVAQTVGEQGGVVRRRCRRVAGHRNAASVLPDPFKVGAAKLKEFGQVFLSAIAAHRSSSV